MQSSALRAVRTSRTPALEFDHKRLKDEREKQGLSRAYVACQVGVTEQAVRKWEKGTEPSATYAAALCDVLSLRLADLVRERKRR